MRQIKFRGWNLNKKMMVYENEDNSHMYFGTGNISPVQLINQNFHQDKYIFMQFTGVLDKNKKEVYEGDIVKLEQFEPKNYTVKFEAGCFALDWGHEVYNVDLHYVENFGEVVGNIYEVTK